MNLSDMTNDELIELVQDLQFSLQESHKVIQQLAKDIPAFRQAKDTETREKDSINKQLSLTQEIEKYDIYKLYDSIVAADIFNGVDDLIAKQKAFNTIFDVLAIEGVDVKKDSLHKHFPNESQGAPD
ncbi:MAG: hypothetical protein KAJ95_07150 [Gammaproteobacteria bacterium]|nr:hypothetical protein [Gammaproteobacteria bacterium]